MHLMKSEMNNVINNIFYFCE
ncbi:hypothetical protein FQ084_00190 [Psychrobacter sp. ANT_WB68]|nr:hypothetical protein FQ084_00190 [Psychrobacter sp. ANT_WB68]